MNLKKRLTAALLSAALALSLVACGSPATQELSLIHISEPTRPY